MFINYYNILYYCDNTGICIDNKDYTNPYLSRPLLGTGPELSLARRTEQLCHHGYYYYQYYSCYTYIYIYRESER